MVYFKDSTSKQFWENKDNVAKRVQVVKRFLFWRYIKEDYLEGTMEQIIRWFRRENMVDVFLDIQHRTSSMYGMSITKATYRLSLPDFLWYEKKEDGSYPLLEDTTKIRDKWSKWEVKWRYNWYQEMNRLIREDKACPGHQWR